MKVGVIVLATGPYIKLVPEMLWSVEMKFLNGVADLKLFILTDQKDHGTQYTILPIEHKLWPYVNVHRYHSILKYAEQFKNLDYIFNLDADLIVKETIGKEVLGSFVALISPTAWKWPIDKYLYERNPKSSAYIPYGQGKYFYNASITGGETQHYLERLWRITAMIDKDELKNIPFPQCHEEAYLCRELLNYPPAISLTPNYCWPEGTYSLKRDFAKPRIIMLNKNKTLDKDKYAR